MRFREAKEAGLDHLPASYLGAKHLNQRKLHFTNGIDLRGKDLILIYELELLTP